MSQLRHGDIYIINFKNFEGRKYSYYFSGTLQYRREDYLYFNSVLSYVVQADGILITTFIGKECFDIKTHDFDMIIDIEPLDSRF